MFDIVFPDRNEHEFLAMAKNLGYTGLVLVYPRVQDPKNLASKGLTVKLAVLAKPSSAHDIKKKNLTFVECSEQDRAVLERGSANVLFNAENTQAKDYAHQRGSGLNQVMCALAKKKNTAIGFSFANILASFGSKRAQILGRMMQNIMLCRKYKVKMIIGSFATDPWKMRSPHDLKAFFTVLGMHPDEAKKALNWL